MADDDDLPPGWTEEQLDGAVRAEYQSRGNRGRPLRDEEWAHAKLWRTVAVRQVRQDVVAKIKQGQVDPAAVRRSLNPHREAQRADDLARLREVRDSLPQGHHERPGLIRAIELLTYFPLYPED